MVYRSQSYVSLAVLLAAALGCGDDPVSPSNPSDPQFATASTASLSFRQLSTGHGHTCGVTAANLAYCWGSNWFGQLGDGSTTDRSAPRAVSGGLRFRQVSAGSDHTCGVTTDNRAYCWGFNFHGELGNGTGYPINTRRLTPTPVVDRKFVQVRAGQAYTCGIEVGTEAGFCWGYNVFGQLGDDTRNDRWRPARVRGGLHFRHLSTGVDHTCGVTTDNRAFCWGLNNGGQLGNGTTVGDDRPLRAAAPLRFSVVHAGRYHSCGLTLDQRAYCWGLNGEGQLGDGTSGNSRLTPVAVTGGLRFDHLIAREVHTCAVTSRNRAYCWGDNSLGEIGDGTTDNDRLRPTPVTGGHLFKGVWTGGYYTCGLASDDRAWCWGSNGSGKLGNGTTTTPIPVPTAVVGPA
jgi:alpha-tubulin suppressor-like RCC1 family protein